MSRTSVNRSKICCATATPRGNLKWEERDSNPLTASPLRQFVNAGQIYSLLPLSSLYVYSTAWRIRTPDTTGWSRMFYHWTKAVFLLDLRDSNPQSSEPESDVLINSTKVQYMSYPRKESNPHLMIRSHLFYPLNYLGFLSGWWESNPRPWLGRRV